MTGFDAIAVGRRVLTIEAEALERLAASLGDAFVAAVETLFAANGRLDDQVSTAATDLSQFLATIVARVSVPDSLHPHNPTLGELGLHPSCGTCRASDPVVYLQPARVWVRVGKLPGSILALPRQPARSLQRRTR